MSFSEYIKAVATGNKGNYELTPFQAEDVITKILTQTFTQSQIGAYLASWRARYETDNELKVAFNTLTKFVRPQNSLPQSIELGYPYDGKSKNSFLYALAAKEVLKDGIELIISSDKTLEPKRGISALELNEKVSFSSNIHLLDRANFLPELSSLTTIRNELTVRTVFNTIEKLTNPCGSKYAIIGLHHKPYVEKYKKILNTRYERLLIVQGDEGSPEMSKSGSIWILEADKLTEQYIDFDKLGIKSVHRKTKMGIKEMEDIIKSPNKEYQAVAKLNAALLLIASKKFDTINQALSHLQVSQ